MTICKLKYLQICSLIISVFLIISVSQFNYPTFLSFSFLTECCISIFFSFLIKVFANFEQLIRFHWQAFIVYKNGENLKILIEIFCPKFIVSNVILVFLNHPKPKIFFVGQLWWPTKRTSHFQNL